MAKTRRVGKIAWVGLLLIGLGAFGRRAAASVVYGGSVQQPYTQAGSMALGTFKPGFDPHSLVALYGDPVGNLLAFYTPLVNDGNFLPLSSGTWTNPNFSGSGPTTTAIAGQRLWLFLFGDPNPNNSLLSVICTGSDPSWFAPANPATVDVLNCNTADTFLFGSGGNGAPLQLGILPFPEPSALCPIVLGGMALLHPRPRRR